MGELALQVLATVLLAAAATPQGPPWPERTVRADELWIGSDLDQRVPIFRDDTVSFEVTARGPRGSSLDLRLRNPPPGMVFDPVIDGGASVQVTVRWTIAFEDVGIHHLMFEARDRSSGRRTLLTRTLRVSFQGFSFTQSGRFIGDVTGDGRLDVVAVAREADGPAGVDQGAIHVWSGSDPKLATPAVTLAVPDATAGEMLGTASGPAVFLDDVSGDGVLDVVVGSSNADRDGLPGLEGAVYVWLGGQRLLESLDQGARRAPDQVLVAPTGPFTPVSMGRTQLNVSSGLLTVDVTGDGASEVLAVGVLKGADGDRRVLYLWKGNGTSGERTPSAVLSAGDVEEGFLEGRNQMFQVVDVTGDGIQDVIVTAPLASVLGVPQEGALHVWAGGPGLEGWPAPTATLAVPGAEPGQGSTLADYVQFVSFGDVTGDGVIDVLLASPLASWPAASTQRSGAVYVFAGGRLEGVVVPAHTWRDHKGHTDDSLGVIEHVADVTGDGLLDVVVGVPWRHGGSIEEAGGVIVFAGGPDLTGDVGFTAELTEKPPKKDRHFGQHVHVADITGEGTLDVIVGSPRSNLGGYADSGAIYAWDGGASLTGSAAPRAIFIEPSAHIGYGLGYRMSFGDVTGDGVLDVLDLEGSAVIATIWSAVGSAGTTSPRARLRGPASAKSYQARFHIGDVTGDGRTDLVTAPLWGGYEAATEAGGAFVLEGGPAVAGDVLPSASLFPEGVMPSEGVGTRGFLLVDLDGDGILDLLTGGRRMDSIWAARPDAALAWRGGGVLAGEPGETWSFTVAGPASPLLLGETLSPHFQFVDLDGNGQGELVSGSDSASPFGVPGAGAVYLWSQPGPAPQTLADPHAAPFDGLGG